MLVYLSGAVLAALGVTALAMWWRGNLLIAMFAGVGTVWFLRMML